jgi:hypothetical protein
VSEYVAKLGFNIIQLPLVTNKGFVYKSRIQPQLAQSVLSSLANVSYGLSQDIEPLIAKAADYGVEIMPEVSISTGAAGWSQSGLTLNCAEHFCGGGEVVTEISRPQLISVLYAVIGELYYTFTSRYIHLGSDERKDAEPCLLEAGIATSEFDVFETELEKILEKSAIGADNLLKWDNKEQTYYQTRTGKITQYRAGPDPGVLKAHSGKSSPFFVTVDILDGDTLSVYEHTRELAALLPTGILAGVRTLTRDEWSKLKIPQRLIAFALGAAAATSANNSSSFHSQYIGLCRALGWTSPDKGGIEGCMPPRALDSTYVHETDTPEFTRRHCDALTVPAQVYKAKKPARKEYPHGVVRVG